MTDIFTVGHSTHSEDVFLELLHSAGVTAIADVRSSPYSRFNPQFNREPLKDALKRAGISYAFLGKELGARSDDPRHYIGGQVSYERLAESDLFKTGIARVLKGAAGHRIALMCAEKDPVTCHRTILVARALVEAGADVKHIGPDGAIEDHAAALSRLMKELRIDAHDLFASPGELVERAYKLQADKIAYEQPDEVSAAE